MAAGPHTGAVGVQWARPTPGDYEWLAPGDWRFTGSPGRAGRSNLARRSELDPRVDGQAGWVAHLQYHGVVFTAEHYALEDLGGGRVRITVWSDDPHEYPKGSRNASVWTFDQLGPDPLQGGAINTRLHVVRYVDPVGPVGDAWRMASPGRTTIRPWQEFRPPDERLVRHGIWLPDGLYHEHWAAGMRRGWREYTLGVPRELTFKGRVRQMRMAGLWVRPTGTKTYYHNATDSALGAYTADNENEAATSATGSPTTETSSSIGGGTDALAWVAWTPSGEPGDSAWPDGTYRYQIDCTTVGADITYGLLTQGGSNGGFLRLNSDGSSELERKAQAQSAFTGTGLNTASVDTTGSSWTSGATSDRFGIALTIARPANHGNQSMSIDVGETDDFMDGPWSAGSTITLQGTIAAQSTVTGDLSRTRGLDGAIASTSTAAGALSVTVDLDGAIGAQSTLTGDLKIVKALAGTIAAQSTASADLTRTRGLVGSVAAQSTVTGALGVTVDLDGAIAAQSTAAASLGVTRTMAGAIAAQSTLTGDLLVLKMLAGTITAQSTVAGDVTRTRGLVGSVVGQATVAGSLGVTVDLDGEPIAAQSTVAAALSVTVDLDGVVAGQSSVAGDVTVQRGLAGDVAAQSTVVGDLKVSRALSGAVAAQSTVTGDLTVTGIVGLAGTIAAQSTVAGDLTLAVAPITLSGTIAAQSIVAGDLTVAYASFSVAVTPLAGPINPCAVSSTPPPNPCTVVGVPPPISVTVTVTPV